MRTIDPSAAKRSKAILPPTLFLLVMVGSLGMGLVLWGVAPSAEAFIYVLESEVGACLVASSGLAVAGTWLAYRGYRAGRRSSWPIVGISVALLVVDLTVAAVLSPTEVASWALVRYLPTLTPAHAILLLVVGWDHWRRPDASVTSRGDSGQL